MEAPLTILTVNFRSEAHLWRNWQLVNQLNPNFPVHWVVVNNDSVPFKAWGDSAGLTVLDGPKPFRKGPGDEGSYHHAAGLMVGMQKVESRFLLVLDGDFFPLQRDWIRRLLSHMQQRGLAAIGSRWNPAVPAKGTSFPSVHFLLLDLQRIPRERIDFTPDLNFGSRRRLALDWASALPVVGRLAQWVRLLWWRGRARDTGWLLGRRFGHLPYEIFDYNLRASDIAQMEQFLCRFPRILRPWMSRFFGWNTASVKKSESRFPSEWESFSWDNSLFAVHFRRVLRGDEGGDLNRLDQWLHADDGPLAAK